MVQDSHLRRFYPHLGSGQVSRLSDHHPKALEEGSGLAPLTVLPASAFQAGSSSSRSPSKITLHQLLRLGCGHLLFLGWPTIPSNGTVAPADSVPSLLSLLRGQTEDTGKRAQVKAWIGPPQSLGDGVLAGLGHALDQVSGFGTVAEAFVYNFYWRHAVTTQMADETGFPPASRLPATTRVQAGALVYPVLVQIKAKAR